VDVVDLLTGTRCFVHEAMGSETLAPRDAILARAVADEVVVFCGVHEVPLDPTNAEAVVAQFGERVSEDGAAQHLFDLWEGQVAERRRKASTRVRVTNTDGHEAETVEDRFALRVGSFEAVFARLAALDSVNVDEHDRAGARFTFTRAGNAKHANWTNTIIGSARLTPTRLVVQTNSSERADALTTQLRDALGDLATWKKRTRDALPELFGGETVMIDGQRLRSPPEAVVRDAYREWLLQPIPLLGGRTPREAVGDAEGRRGVHLLLKQQENHHARKPIEGLDPAQLRREPRTPPPGGIWSQAVRDHARLRAADARRRVPTARRASDARRTRPRDRGVEHRGCRDARRQIAGCGYGLRGPPRASMASVGRTIARAQA